MLQLLCLKRSSFGQNQELFFFGIFLSCNVYSVELIRIRSIFDWLFISAGINCLTYSCRGGTLFGESYTLVNFYGRGFLSSPSSNYIIIELLVVRFILLCWLFLCHFKSCHSHSLNFVQLKLLNQITGVQRSWCIVRHTGLLFNLKWRLTRIWRFNH